MLVTNFASQCDLCGVRLAAEAMERQHRPGPRAMAVFTCWHRTRPRCRGSPACLPVCPCGGGLLSHSPQAPWQRLLERGPWVARPWQRQSSGTLGQGHHGLGGRWCHCRWGHGLGQPWDGVGWAVPRPGVCRAVRGKGRALCVYVCRFPGLPSTCGNLPPEQLPATSRESRAQNQSGSWHRQVPSIPAGSSQPSKRRENPIPTDSVTKANEGLFASGSNS